MMIGKLNQPLSFQIETVGPFFFLCPFVEFPMPIIIS